MVLPIYRAKFLQGYKFVVHYNKAPGYTQGKVWKEFFMDYVSAYKFFKKQNKDKDMEVKIESIESYAWTWCGEDV